MIRTNFDFRLSKKKRIPILYVPLIGEMYFWQLYYIPKCWFQLRFLKRMGFQFIVGSGIAKEWRTFEKNYLPPPSVKKSDLILDVGGKDGDSAVFYWAHGYENLKVVEPNKDYFPLLEHNLNIIRSNGGKVELVKRCYSTEDLATASFAKFDCEGCEYEVGEINIPYIMMLHEKVSASSNGIYPYVKEIGVRKG